MKLYDETIEQSDGDDGREAVIQSYNVKRNDGEMLVFGVVTTNIIASAYEISRYYNLDLKKNKLLSLKDVFIESKEYITIIDIMEYNIKNADKSYFVEKFEGIDENTNFYINENKKLIIVFNEYEIVPGYMGMPEFEIDTELLVELISAEK